MAKQVKTPEETIAIHVMRTTFDGAIKVRVSLCASRRDRIDGRLVPHSAPEVDGLYLRNHLGCESFWTDFDGHLMIGTLCYFEPWENLTETVLAKMSQTLRKLHKHMDRVRASMGYASTLDEYMAQLAVAVGAITVHIDAGDCKGNHAVDVSQARNAIRGWEESERESRKEQIAAKTAA